MSNLLDKNKASREEKSWKILGEQALKNESRVEKKNKGTSLNDRKLTNWQFINLKFNNLAMFNNVQFWQISVLATCQFSNFQFLTISNFDIF